MKTCFFIGHRHIGDDIVDALEAAVEQHIVLYGVTDFVVGGYGEFDRMAAAVLRRAKQAHPEITLTRLVPYHPAERPAPPPKGFDSTFYPPGMEKVPRRYAISRANRWMVEHSDYLIAAPRGVGNSWNLTDLALRRQKQGLICVTILT